MTDKALITKRGLERSTETAKGEISEAETLRLKVEWVMSQGTLVSGNPRRMADLDRELFRVKRLPDTNLLRIGEYTIDIEKAPPRVPNKLGVPAKLAKQWIHHLIQLIGPVEASWRAAIEAECAEVVEPVGPYSLFIVADPEIAKRVAALPFVAWSGPMKPAYRVSPQLRNKRGMIRYVAVSVYPAHYLAEVREFLAGIDAVDAGEDDAERDDPGAKPVLFVEMGAKHLASLAQLPGVRWLDYVAPRLIPEDERTAQIVAENLDGTPPPNTLPVTGYKLDLATLGLDGGGVTVGICDSGVDTNDNANMHPDLQGRMSFFVDLTGGAAPTDAIGHGTHVAGIAVGNGTSGDADAQGFVLGQGVAPGADFGVVNAASQIAPTTPLIRQSVRQMSQNDVEVMNNSWRDFEKGIGAGYTINCQYVDKWVRDPDPAAAGFETLTFVFSAGNHGGRPMTLSTPKEAKNAIIVGNSLNARPGEAFPRDDIRGVSATSSRGPTVDGRIMPTVVAPGTDVISTRSSAGQDSAYTDIIGVAHPNYSIRTGTSQSAPHVSGLCALIIEWWRERTGGTDPSSAMLKALLVNGAVDMAGGENWKAFSRGETAASGGNRQITALGFVPDMVIEETVPGYTTFVQVGNQVRNPGEWSYNVAQDTLTVRPTIPNNFRLHVRDSAGIAAIPSNDQGWGRISLENIVLQAPDSDRGPKIFVDQRHAFTVAGQEYLIRIAPDDSARPMRITLVWTDAAAALQANPSLVNGLNLEVTELATGNVYLGNVFNNGFSTTGGDFSNNDNVECVYLQNPGGEYEVRVIAYSLLADARLPSGGTPWQDFALVIDNANVPAVDPIKVVPVIDRSSSMASAGYVDVTRIGSKQFIDTMSLGDELGVVSFGSSGTIEYPIAAMPALQPIGDPAGRAAARMAIDGITFNGSTAMGEGLDLARGLLGAVPPGPQAVLLLSDGYDNRTPSALDVVSGYPASLPIYSCAMGPLSDQALMEQLAKFTGGRYYYMPTQDDLFEIYNFIRGQVTSEGLIVNESAFASSSKISGFVDAFADEVTFSITWADKRTRFVVGEPHKASDISVRLRNPRGRLIHASDGYVKRIVGIGYVIFQVPEPLPGLWHVEVETARRNHIRYTVGGFVKSPIRLDLSLPNRSLIPMAPIRFNARVLAGDKRLTHFQANAVVVSPPDTVQLQNDHKTLLARMKVPAKLRKGELPANLAKLISLRDHLIESEGHDLFAGNVDRLAMRHLDKDPHSISTSQRESKSVALPPIPDGLQAILQNRAPRRSLGRVSAAPFAASGVTVGNFTGTVTKGSYNIRVKAVGVEPRTGSRFARVDMASVLVH